MTFHFAHFRVDVIAQKLNVFVQLWVDSLEKNNGPSPALDEI